MTYKSMLTAEYHSIAVDEGDMLMIFIQMTASTARSVDLGLLFDDCWTV